MKNTKAINILVFILGILVIIISLVGILSSSGAGEEKFTSIFGEEITLYSKGIYHNNSLAVTAQGIAQDYVSLILSIPLLFYSLWVFNKNL